MADVAAAVAAGDLSFLDEEAFSAWVVEQRWFGSKAREVSGFSVAETIPLRSEAPMLALALVEVRFQPGTHELYQVPLGFRPAEEGWADGVVAETGGWTVYDALADRVHGRELVQRMRGSASVSIEDAQCEFRSVRGLAAAPGGLTDVRPVGAEQSNSSVVFDDALILKVYRRIEPGPNPELELLRFLTERSFTNIARLAGWYEQSGRLVDATLGLLQEFLPDARDAWEAVLDALEGGGGFLRELRSLGETTGRMHSVLGSEASDPTFAPEEPSTEALALLTAMIDEQIERVFLDLPAGDERVEPIAGRGEEIREQLRLLSHIGAGGRVIRHHGDYHLGQCLLTGRGWVILDFEGEPARSLTERRRKRSPLRDVAGMLRSFAYAASALSLQRGGAVSEGWEADARRDFLEGYLSAVDPALLPPGQDAIRRLLSVFELEKAIYELHYELNNRPDWVGIPVAGILRLLEGEEP